MGVQRFPPNPDAIWMYEHGGLSCKDIAPMFGVSESTVKRWMRGAGVIRSDASKQGRPPKDECVRGHDLSKTRKRTPKGHPYCGECRRIRDKENHVASKKTPTPKQPKRYGKESPSFSKPPPVEKGACPTCGATPPCTPHK